MSRQIIALQIALAATVASFAETRDPWQRGALAQQAQSYRIALRELGA